MKQRTGWLGACTGLLVFSGGLACAYEYPFADPYVATVISTPAEYAKELPKKAPIKLASIEMFPGREVPEILWNFKKLRYSYLRQKGPAPSEEEGHCRPCQEAWNINSHYCKRPRIFTKRDSAILKDLLRRRSVCSLRSEFNTLGSPHR